jgi:hypothetical protein
MLERGMHEAGLRQRQCSHSSRQLSCRTGAPRLGIGLALGHHARPSYGNSLRGGESTLPTCTVPHLPGPRVPHVTAHQFFGRRAKNPLGKFCTTNLLRSKSNNQSSIRRRDIT